VGRILNIVTLAAFRPQAPSAHTIADPEVLRLFRRMEELKRLDYELDIHGAWTRGSGHRYKYERMSNADLARLESELGVEVPDQCRRWLTNVGRGAGPGYGLICRNADWPAPIYQDPVPSRAVREVSELTPELLLKFDAAMKESEDIELFGVRGYRGLMTLCEHGCGWESLLIVAGPMKGHVIEDMGATGAPVGTFAAGYGNHGKNVLPTFFQWLDYWIARSIGEVAQARLQRIKRDRRYRELRKK
jgi:hypothetical protein